MEKFYQNVVAYTQITKIHELIVVPMNYVICGICPILLKEPIFILNPSYIPQFQLVS